jgi:glycine/D-amino acid oxidase-like deaminating enzyme
VIESHDPRSVIVAGGGILGCLTSLLLVEAGRRVTLLEQNDELWLETSSVGEGKIHLGLVYAHGSDATRSGMLSGALAFAPVIERALGHAVDWAALSGDPFDYLVMRDSLLRPDELAAVYRSLDDEHIALGRPPYLGRAVDRLAARAPHTDETGMPAFATAERAVDPDALRALVVAAIAARSESLTVLRGARVEAVDQAEDAVSVRVSQPRSPDAVADTLRAAAFVDARWHWQGHGVQGVSVGARNLRAKSAVIFDAGASARTVTLALGPFGDVVRRTSTVYASWYPHARIAHEHRPFASNELLAAVDAANRRTDLEAAAAPQRSALVELGLLSPDARALRVHTGFIVGDGPTDIDVRDSLLHDRAGAGVALVGHIALPRNFKLTTAPSAALATATAIDELLRSGSRS